MTLEPVDSAIEEGFDVTFWPEEDMPAPRGGEVDLDEEADPEPIVAGQIDVGRVVFECLAAGDRSVPEEARRNARAAARSQPADSGPGKPESPFAVLANIKAKVLKTAVRAARVGGPRASLCRAPENLVVSAAAKGYGRSFSGGCGFDLVRPLAAGQSQTGEHGASWQHHARYRLTPWVETRAPRWLCRVPPSRSIAIPT